MPRFYRLLLTVALIASFPFLDAPAARAGTTGVISGTITDEHHRPISGVRVTAASPSATGSATTDSSGFFNIASLPPDTYTISFQKQNFQATSIPGVVVYQDQTNTVNASLREALRTIANVQTRSSQNLVQPNQTADVYQISSQQLEAAQGGDNVHKTLYDFTQSVPGVTGAGANAQPRVRGGLATDASFLYDDVPINDRLTGFFSTGNGYFQTTTISAVGVSNVQVYTGGFDSRFGDASQGIFNSVVKRGTYPSYGLVSVAERGTLFGHYLQMEYGTATPDRKLSAYFAYDRANMQNAFGDGTYSFPLAATTNPGQGPGPQMTVDAVANFHYRPDNKNDLQVLIQNGNGLFNGNYLLAGGHPMGVAPCTGVQGYWVPAPPVGAKPPAGQTPGFNITNPGVSNSGQPCVVTINGKQYNTGMQYIALDPNRAQETYHYSGVGKIQLNHIFNEKLSGFFRLAENFNQYILNQPLDNANFNNSIQPGQPAPVGNYVAAPFPVPTIRDFFGDRRQNAYYATSELDWNPDARSSYYAGISYERDTLLQAYYDRSGTSSYSNPPSAFDAKGNWPNEYTLANFPTFIDSTYVGTVQKIHKLVVEPSLRYDIEIYDIPKSAGGAYSKPVFSPRIALGYQLRPDLVIRGSYGITSSFIPATYVYNNSIDGIQGAGQYRNPYLPGATLDPAIDHNVDLSIEKAFRDGHTSLRVTPWYHQTNNRLEVLRNPLVVNGQIQLDSNGNVVFLPGSVAKSGGIDKDFGVEVGLNHIVYGDGLSWFLAATYENYWSTSFTLNAAAINPQDPKSYFLNGGKGQQFRVPDQPPISVSFTGNYRYHRYHFLPYVLWQCCAYYNVQGRGNAFTPDRQVHTSPGYFYANATFSYDLAKDGPRTTRIGVRITNLFDNQKNNVYPSVNTCYNRPAKNATAPCGAPGSGGVWDGNLFNFAPGAVPNTLYFYPPVSRNPQTFEIFLTQEL